jgi:hypothetical protein
MGIIGTNYTLHMNGVRLSAQCKSEVLRHKDNFILISTVFRKEEGMDSQLIDLTKAIGSIQDFKIKDSIRDRFKIIRIKELYPCEDLVTYTMTITNDLGAAT